MPLSQVRQTMLSPRVKEHALLLENVQTQPLNIQEHAIIHKQAHERNNKKQSNKRIKPKQFPKPHPYN